MDEKDLEIIELKQQLATYKDAVALAERKLAAAVEDIPHVGRFCSYIDKYGCCSIDNRYCHRQAHTVCPHWEWRGESGKENTRHGGTN